MCSYRTVYRFRKANTILAYFIHWAITKLLKIKVIKQDNTEHKTYIRDIPLNAYSGHRLDIKYI